MFTEYVEAVHFDDDSDREEAPQQTEFDVDSVREASSLDMVCDAESIELDAKKSALWKRITQNSVLSTFDDAPSRTPSSTPSCIPSSKLASEDQQAWQDMLESSSLPGYERALVETQEGEDKISTEEHEHKDCAHEGNVEDRDHGDFDDANVVASVVESGEFDSDDEIADEESVDYEHDEVASHMANLVSDSENVF
ncbi:hypothetical protein GN958_ATG07416 [Phytophthora infestans]|uniref:Uncharacterized protein n=1 Tax=Phytophthora infestans TaxID=4787 RepID=A0A8S9URN6_PHYIN|nr:hypothetical protein GN958_ATG07416 [Phytophthora infestans]